jgi:WD40 repeat protein
MQVTMTIENLGCWGDCVFILFFLFNLFLCDATVFKYDQVNKFVHTQESEKGCREEHVRKYDIPYSLMMLHGCSTGQKYIYTGSHDGCVYIFDMVTGKQVGRLSFHRGTVRDCSWHPTQPMLVSSSWDGNLAKWEHLHGDKPQVSKLCSARFPQFEVDNQFDSE